MPDSFMLCGRRFGKYSADYAEVIEILLRNGTVLHSSPVSDEKRIRGSSTDHFSYYPLRGISLDEGDLIYDEYSDHWADLEDEEDNASISS